MRDIKNRSLKKFSNLDDSINYINRENQSSIMEFKETRIAAEIFRLSITYEVDVRNNIIGTPPELRDWGTHIDYEVNSRYGIALKGRSVLDDEKDLERVPFVRFEAGRIPMTPESTGLVNFKPFVDSAFPLQEIP